MSAWLKLDILHSDNALPLKKNKLEQALSFRGKREKNEAWASLAKVLHL